MQLSELRGQRHYGDRLFSGLAVGAATVVLLVLGMIAVTMTERAWPAFGADFFTSNRWTAAETIFGARAFIWGTLYTAAIAISLAVPISLGVALFVTQVAPPWLKKPMVYLLDLLAVVPSVVFGLWGVLVLATRLQGVYAWLHELTTSGGGCVVPLLLLIFGAVLISVGRKTAGAVLAALGALLLVLSVTGVVNIPAHILGPEAQGKSFATAGIILAVMIIPIITSLAREVIETTPPSEKEAALALGATRWEMIQTSVLPHSKGGLVGAVMLGLGRAMGETIAAALVIGSSVNTSLNVFAPGNSMPAVIANEWGEADAPHKAALIALAVTLFVITIAVNLLATWIVQRSIKRSRGA